MSAINIFLNHNGTHQNLPYIHKTPLLTCQTLDRIASSSDPRTSLSDDEEKDQKHNDSTSSSTTNGASPPTPKFRLHFKCENMQKIGAFKARGAFHAVLRLVEELGIDEVRKRGVVTHSSGNHAQALALAAATFDIPAYIVMPRISTPSKIAGTKLYTQHVIFSGSTSTEREEVVEQVIRDTGAILVPPYDHPDIILGQGTVGREMEMQFLEQQQRQMAGHDADSTSNGKNQNEPKPFDAVIAPIGGGGLLGGIATWFSQSSCSSGSISTTQKPKKTQIFGTEPSFQGADDARRGLAQSQRVEHVKSLTIADGLRTPVGLTNWSIVSDKSKLQAIYAVTEFEIKMAMRLVFERMKLVVEPSGVVGLAVLLFNSDFRQYVVEQQQKERYNGENQDGKDIVWDVGIVFSGGNTTIKAISSLFTKSQSEDQIENKDKEREKGKLDIDGNRKVEDIPG